MRKTIMAFLLCAACGKDKSSPTSPLAGSCSGITPLALAVGEVHTLTTAERATLCVAGGAAGSEYVLVPFKADTVSALLSISILASGTTSAGGAPTAAADLIPAASDAGRFTFAPHGPFGAAFEN